MPKNVKFKINASITDFPILMGLDSLFKAFKNTGIDGVELVTGLKFRWSLQSVETLSKKYDLPIVSIHQPIWSGLGIYFDKNFINLALKVGIKNFVFHPLPRVSFQDKKMRKYFKKLYKLQKDYKIQIMLENLPNKYSMQFVNQFFSPHPDTKDIISILAVAEEFNFKITYDTAHMMSNNPHLHEWFEKIFPKIGNIHLSSYNDYQSHLPLYQGDFASQEFISYLYRKHYNGLLTLEIYYPRLLALKAFDFSAIKKSVDIIRAITPN